MARCRTYQWIAKQIKNPLSMRAAGSALGRNPLPIVVPCHRVIREDGLLGGFSAPLGVEMKAALLKLEGVSRLEPYQLTACMTRRHRVKQHGARNGRARDRLECC